MIRISLKFFIFSSGLGLLMSLILHIFSLLNYIPFSPKIMSLGFGIFIVWIPTIFALIKLSEHYPRNEIWGDALRGCPKSIRIVAYSCWLYIIINVFISALSGVEVVMRYKPNDPFTPAVLRSFSTIFMGFYAMSFAVLVSALNLHEGRSS